MSDSLSAYIGGRSCAILGLGISHLPLARVLADLGLSLTVYDKKSLDDLGDEAKALARRGVSFLSGDGCFDAIGEDLIFRSPGIRPDLPGIVNALARGAELTSEIELYLSLNEGDSYAVTGSDGKTTSTTLTGKFLSAEAERTARGKVLVGGNIGQPLLYRLSHCRPEDTTVMELSSFQLMTVRKAPRQVAITNLSPNHLNWHLDMDEYIRAKANIIGKETRRVVTNAENGLTAALASDLLGRKDRPALYLFSSVSSSFGEIFPEGGAEADRAIYAKDGFIVIDDGTSALPLLDISAIRLPGRHNLENYMTAIGLTYGRVDASVYRQVAEHFTGVSHRLEPIRTLDGVDYINSSIDSSPTRTAAALSALAGRDIVIICGGQDKKIPFDSLAKALCASVRGVVLTGQAAPQIEAALLACPDYRPGHPVYCVEPSFSDAVHRARTLAKAGGCVLLSPACTSFDAFRNFEERGDTFRQIVKNF